MPTPDGRRFPASEPWAYFLTIACYGRRLHGDPRGSIDRDNNQWGTPILTLNSTRQISEQSRMREDRAELDTEAREIVLKSIQSVSRHENWALHAVHVRSAHAHIVLGAAGRPEKVAGKLKAYASRALNEAFGKRSKRWTPHASTVYLWDAREVDNAVHYVVHEQGAPMACYVNPNRWQEHIRSPKSR